ncbi:hypothetical protein ACP70R_002433 [Stipagrostis hirtigluma subsp. patula]
MGSAAAAVEISSDDDVGEKMPVGGNRKSSEDALDWASKLLAEDCDAVGEGLDDSGAIQELLASLMDATEVVVDGKERLVDGKRSVRDADDDGDDDDCVILDGDPDRVVAVAKQEGSRRDASEDELQIVAEKGELACRDFPHPRHLCASLPFNTSSHASHCSMCHCYVCDSPAPCAFWGKGNMVNDHCHATDKDAKWKKLRQSAKRKSQPMPKRGSIQNLFNSSSTTTPLQPCANVMPSAGRNPASSIVRQSQHVHPSAMVSQNMWHGIHSPQSPTPMSRSTVLKNRSKRARVGPTVYTPSNGSHLHSSAQNYVPMQQANRRAFQTAQLPPEDNVSAGSFQGYPPLRRPSAPIVSQGCQFQPTTYPQVAPNSVISTGLQLPQCTTLATQGRQQSQGSSADTRIWKDAIANLAYELGVPDYNMEPLLGQQSTSIQPLHPNQLVSQVKSSQGVNVNRSYVAAPSQMINGHNLSNHASGGIVLASGSIQTRQPLCQLIPESSLTPSETVPSNFVAPPSMKH